MSIIEDPKILEITGRTRVLGILAHPTEHVKAPPGINRIAMMRGRDAVMVPLNVAPADLESFVASLRVLKSFDGAIVTVPHKQAIIRLCDEVSPQALAVGAANVLRRKPDGRLIGDQLDGIGFVEGLGDQDIAVSGRGVYLVGAGGAANAIAFALAEAGITRLTLANRTVEKIETLAAKLKGAYP
ncbi:shikimate dehydrogenase, partial [Rhizobium ruizarguesonis]